MEIRPQLLKSLWKTETVPKIGCIFDPLKKTVMNKLSKLYLVLVLPLLRARERAGAEMWNLHLCGKDAGTNERSF